MSNKLRILIVGGTSTIAERCARVWLQKPCELILLGRDAEKLQRVKNDLQVRYPNANIETQLVSFLDAQTIQACIRTLNQQAAIDIALIAHGYLPNQEQCQTNISLCKEAIEINAISPVLFAEAQEIVGANLITYMVHQRHSLILIYKVYNTAWL